MANDATLEWHHAGAGAYAWHVRPTLDGIEVYTLTPEGAVIDKIVLRSRGVGIVVDAPVHPKLDEVPELAQLKHVIEAHRFMAKRYDGRMQPALVYTKQAEAMWPIFGGALGTRPPSGVANVVGGFIAWSPELDHYLESAGY